MEIVPYVLIKKAQLFALRHRLSLREREMEEATQFIKAIEDGNLDIGYQEEETKEGSDNILASSLISMRKQMKHFAQEEQQRKWVTEGLAQFVDILRAKNEDLSLLADGIISHLVKYMQANQGALYVLNDDVQNDQHLEMIACYAYDRKKHLHQRIDLGEGLTGQVVLEKDTIYMTDIPQNYIKITSGLGHALPNTLLLVPLKIEDKVYGVVEIASFSKIKQYQIEFVEKLGESIAATISTAKVNARTRKLLQDSQQQTETMRSQEEEMRQNMEELSATQEDMQRILKEVQEKEGYLNAVLDASNDSIFTIDKSYKIISFNKAFARTLELMGMVVKKGLDMVSVLNEGKERETQIQYYRRAFMGEYFEVVNTFTVNGIEATYVNSYSPLSNAEGEIFALAIFAKDTSELTKAQKDAELAYQTAHEKELYMQNMLNATTDAILTVDKDLHIVLANNVMINTFKAQGINIDVGFHVTQLTQPGKEEDFMAPYKKAFAGETIEMIREYFDRAYLITYNPMYDDQNQVIGVSLFTKEVTESRKLQRQTEQLLAQSQQQAEELKAQEEEIRQNMEELSATQEGMQRHVQEMDKLKRELEIREAVLGHTTILSESDLQGNITFANDKFCEVSQYSREELIGKPHNILRHPDMPKELFTLFWETIKKGGIFKGILKNQAKDGSHYWVDATIVPVTDEMGKIVKYVGARYHITNEEIAVALYKAQAQRLGWEPVLK